MAKLDLSSGSRTDVRPYNIVIGVVSIEAAPITISGPMSTESPNFGGSYDDIQFQEETR